MGQVKQGGNAVMNYAYNGRGEQTRRYPTPTSTAQTYASYDEAGHTVGIYDHTGNRIQEVIWLGDLPIGVIDTSKLHYVQADHLGTPRNVIDPVTEKSVWAWQLGNEAFGDSAPNQDPDNNGTAFVFDLRFPGQRYDAASGQNYNYFRDYDASIGRYVESDPIGLSGGPSTFGYVGGSPLLWRDSFGLLPGQCYSSADEAAANALNDINPRSIREGREYAGWIYKTANGWYSYTAPRPGAANASDPGNRVVGGISHYHTHGKYDPGYGNEIPSAPDWRITPFGQSNYLGTPSGRFVKYKYNGQVSEIDKPSPDGDCGKNDCSINRNESWFYRILTGIGYYDP